MLGGAFLGGYYAGRQPGSPDIFARARQAYEFLIQASRQAEAVTTGDDEDMQRLLHSGDMTLAVEGKTYHFPASNGKQPEAPDGEKSKRPRRR